MTDSPNVISFSPRATDITARQKTADQAKTAQEAMLIAKLCLMPALTYERERTQAARKLGCRVSFLDDIRLQAGLKIASFRSDSEICCTNSRVGTCINFQERDGSSIPSWCLASGETRWGQYKGQETNLLLLADGNATMVRGVDLSFMPHTTGR
jgi:hypothetical protein